MIGWMIVWGWACVDPYAPTTTSLPGSNGPLRLPEPPGWSTGDAVGAVRLRVATDRPARLDVTWEDERRSWPRAATHDVPIVGLGVGRDVQVVVTLRSADGAVVTSTQRLPIDSLSLRGLDIDVLAHDPERAEPGHLLVQVEPPGNLGLVVLLDEGLDLAWAWQPDRNIGDLRPIAGGLQLVSEGTLFRLDWLGNVTPLLPGLPSDLTFHHEAYPLADGGWLGLDYQSTFVARYPSTEDGVPGFVSTERAFRLAADGRLVRDAPFEELLDLTRVNDNALRRTVRGFDWIHTNGIIEDPRDGGWIVSARHQSALFEIDLEGELDWILADPAGFGERFVPKLLTPVGDLTWPDAQHAPELVDDVLVVFDNRMVAEEPSRVVGYRIDEAAGTVEEAFVFDQTATGPESSRALGDADVQPVTGNVLATYGFLDGWGGRTAEQMGIGRRATALVEWARNDPDHPVIDVRFSSRDAEGWKAYRAEKLVLPGDFVDP